MSGIPAKSIPAKDVAPHAGRLAPAKKPSSNTKVSSASSRADGITQRGKTRGRYV